MVSKKKFGRVFSRSRFRVDPLILLTDKGRVVAFLEKVERGGKKLELPFYLSLSLSSSIPISLISTTLDFELKMLRAV